MTQEDIKTTEEITLSLSVTPVINYSLYHNGVKPVQSITIANHTDRDLNNLTLTLESVPAFAVTTTVEISFIPAGKSYEIQTVDLPLDADYLAGMTERIEGELRARLDGEETLASARETVSVLAFDQWGGQGNHPELLTSFVTPNHPMLATIISRAAGYLNQWVGSPSFSAYQSNDPNFVLKQAAALYCALKEENLIYCVSPASFEEVGQRVRLCDMVLQQKMGNCLELTLLYASCLEAVGLHPLMILVEGHIFAGVWLEEKTFPDAVQDDPTVITKRLADGVNEIAVVECTSMVNGNGASFDDAVASAERQCIGKNPIHYIIDVRRARLCGITPIPQRVHDSDGWHITHDLPQQTTGLYAPEQMGDTVVVDPDAFDPQSVPKMVQWERKLLDLGLRNNLINLRFSKNIVPLLSTSLDELEDSLSQGEGYAVLPRPAEWERPGEIGFETMQELSSIATLVNSEFRNGRLRAILSEAELTKTMKTLYRNAKTAMEENGANTLYLVLGVLRWYETPRSQKARYAPVVLLPVEIVRRAGNKGYNLRLRDDDPQINVTILEKIKQDFGINVSGLDPLPMDEKGVDLRRVFTILRKATMEQARWDVLESAYLGIFSFSQFVMWSDLRHRSEDLLRNKVVRSLIDGKLAWEAKPMVMSDRVQEQETLLPMPADASQLFAIQEACRGESFVLHGPPGTGKSQTITSLIANALAQGKSVLFVAEKKAALEVVQKRLENIGIAPFCLELHSNKAKKRSVLDQLRAATEVTRRVSPAQYAEKAERLRTLREGLDEYAARLHEIQPCGYSLFALINSYEEFADAPDLVVFGPEFTENTGNTAIESHTILLERLVAAGKAVGHPHNHPLAEVGLRQYSQQLRATLPDKVTAYRQAAEAFIPHAQRLADILAFGPITDAEAMDRLLELARQVAVFDTLPKAWASVENPGEYFAAIAKMAEHLSAYYQRKRHLSASWSEGFFALNSEELLAECNALQEQWIVPRAMGLHKLTKRLAPYATGSVADVTEAITILYRMHQEQAAGEELLRTYGDDLGALFRGEDTNWKHIEELSVQARVSILALQEYTGNSISRATLCSNSDAIAAAKAMVENHDTFRRHRSACCELLCLADRPGEDWLSGQIGLCDAILNNTDGLKEWITFVGIAAEVSDAGLGCLVAAYRQGADHDALIAAYKKAAYRALIMSAIDRQGVLNAFSGPVFNEKIAQYKRMDAEFTQLVQEELFCRLAANIPDFTAAAAQSSELGTLQRMIKSGGRGTSIRHLFEMLPNLLPRLCPCMLMSPISAAQYLDPRREPFDIVVFDEASQLPTCKAVGVLARGHNAVIVGDPKQMPPTTFFATNTVDEENWETEDLESILDDCLAINMPQTHLLWHYRSRHESLIAFSNRQFYENKLFTFPSVNDRESKVSLVHVDGVFQRGKGRRNQAEAEAVVAELRRRCHDPELSRLSVGVITFNIAQQHLIDDLLLEACETDPELEAWMNEGNEPLFVKNLENVQGDEREVILFSVGYGPDENGKVFMNFGPLNRDGGWRRLNVAVSRARSEMVVFSTLTPDQIDLSKTSAEGVAALKAFLSYAAGSELALNESSSRQLAAVKDGIARRLCSLLEAEGYATDRNVGHSEYKIDVGVVDPNNPDRYILGVLLDGAGYESAKTTRDRELAQIGILNGLGWNVLRVWTMDWWDNRQKEIDRIVAELQRLSAGEPAEEAASAGDTEPDDLPEDTEPDAEEVTPFSDEEANPAPQTEPVAPACLQTYAVTLPENPPLTSEQLLSGENDYQLLRALDTVLTAEAPIYGTLLWKRVLAGFGITRTTARLQEHLSYVADNLHPYVTYDGDEVIYWNKHQDPENYYLIRACGTEESRREPTMVPRIEVVNAMCYVLRTQIGIPRDDLSRETVKLLGYRYLVGTTAAMTAEALSLLLDQGLAKVDDRDCFSLTPIGETYAEHLM